MLFLINSSKFNINYFIIIIIIIIIITLQY